jgi:hypothetical protein
MKNTAGVTGGNPIAVCSQSISGVNAYNPLGAFYDIHRRKGEVLFFCFALEAKYEFATLNTRSIASIVAMDVL